MGNRRRNLIVLGLVLALVAASAWVISDKRTVLGLDLRGGTELIYQARATPQVPDPSPDDIDRAIENIRDRVDALGVSEPEISRVGERGISVGLPDVSDADRAIEQVGTPAQLYLYDFEPNVIPRNPDDADPSAHPYNRLIDAVEAASKQDPVSEAQCREQGCTTNGQYYLFDSQTLQPLGEPSANREDLFLPYGGEQPPNSMVKFVPRGTVVIEQPPIDDQSTQDVDESELGNSQFFVMRDQPALSGDEIEDPKPSTDPTTSQPNVTFDFTDEGREAFARVTQEIADRGKNDCFAALQQPCTDVPGDVVDQFAGTFAIVLDQKIESRPIIDWVENPTGIDGRTGAQISGSFTPQEANDLAEILRIGALPVDLALISQSTVSATLGQEALDQGLKAGLVGLAIVVLFLIAYYRFLGVVAALGLLVYAVFFYAMIKLIPITLITAFILFVLATAGVKGFAFTLGIGTIVSLFTAVLFTQAVLAVLGRAKFLRSPAFLGASGEGRRWKFDFTGASKWFFSVSGLILAVGAIAFATKQLNLGIDFESGTRIDLALAEPATVDEVREVLTGAGIEGAENAKIQEVENEALGANALQIEGKIPPDDAAEVQTRLDDAFGIGQSAEGDAAFDNTSIGPTFGEQVARSAVIAIIFSLLVICAYVAIRFEAKYAVPVLIALVHDILITGGVYALVGAEVSSATVAAFLTILGYSMYDCIIVFDRIRENVPRMPRAAFSQIVNRSMSEVLTRSLITGLSTVFLIAVLLVFGGETLRDFAFAMMVGVFSGTYSSIFIASPVLTAWKEREPTYRSRRARILEAMGFVPTFPEDNQVAKIDQVERHISTATAGDGAPEPARPQPAPALEEAPVAVADPPVERSAEVEPTLEEADAAVAGRPDGGAERTQRPARKKQQSRRRRKHGRRR